MANIRKWSPGKSKNPSFLLILCNLFLYFILGGWNFENRISPGSFRLTDIYIILWSALRRLKFCHNIEHTWWNSKYLNSRLYTSAVYIGMPTHACSLIHFDLPSVSRQSCSFHSIYPKREHAALELHWNWLLTERAVCSLCALARSLLYLLQQHCVCLRLCD